MGAPLLSDATLAQLGAWATDTIMSASCDIYRAVETITSLGGHTSVWSIVLTSPCALVDVGGSSPREFIAAGQLAAMIDKLLLLPRFTDIHDDDYVRLNGVIYHVVGIYEPSTFEVVRRVIVRRDTTGFEAQR